MKYFQLSYPVTTMRWDGVIQTKFAPEQYLPALQSLKALAIDEVMITGYFAMLDTAFDLDEDSKRLGDVLERLQMRPAQHHGWAGLYTP